MAMELSSPSSSAPSFSPQASLLNSKEYSAFAIAKLRSEVSPRRSLSASISPSSAIVAAAWLSAGSALAISFDEITLPEPSVALPPEVDVSAIVDSVTGFVAENPWALIAGVAVVGLPLVVSSLFSQAKPWGSVFAREALKKLEAEGSQLLDIRSREDIKTEGTPDLRTIKKRVFQIPFTPGEDEVYLKKLLSKFKDPSNSTLYILDQFDGNSISVAKFITANGFKSAYAIKDGAEGPNGWRRNELPWLLPRKGFTLDISGLKDVIDSTFSENPNLVPATLGVAAAAGVSLVVFSEAETALQLLGSAALIQLFVKKFLFAKDRQKTLQELQTFLDTKIAPKGLVDELKGIGGLLLPKYDEVAPADSTNGAVATTAESSQEAEVQSEVVTMTEQVEEKQMESITETASDTPSSSAASTDLPQSSAPLSPYTQFPGLKPPSSPTPSRP